MGRALEGVTVLDASRLVAGPYAGWLLATMGANVIRMEPPAGDTFRASGKFKGISGMFVLVNRGKRAFTLNLAEEKGRNIFKELAGKSDVVIENFVPGTMEKWRLSYKDLSKINPRLISASVSGFGRGSKYEDRPGTDPVMQAMTGHMASTGFRESPPTLSGVAYIDVTVAVFLTAGILAALYAREKSGLGQQVEVAMRDAGVAMAFGIYNSFYETGRVMKRWGNSLAGYSPTNSYQTEDGYVYLNVSTEPQFAKLAKTLGLEHLATDTKYKGLANRWANRAELEPMIEQRTRTMKRWDLYEQLSSAGVPCGVVMDVTEVLNDEDLNAKGMFQDIDQPAMGKVKVHSSPIRLSDSPQRPEVAPLLGQQTEEIFKEFLGYGPEQIAELKSRGIV